MVNNAMEKVTRLMLIPLITILLCYIILNLGLYVFQDYLIFFPRKLHDNSIEVVENRKYEININVGDVVVHGWLLNKGESKLIIYYGGNAEEVSANIYDMKAIDGYSILLMNYRGYGLSEGKPGEKVLFSDALNIYDHAINVLDYQPENIVLFGRSLGSGVAVYVASKRDVSKIILVTPYDSIRNIARGQFTIIPIGLILKHPFDSILHAKNVSSSLLMIIGGRDRTIPNANSWNLAKNWKGECKPICNLD